MNNNLPKLALGTWLMGGTRMPDPDNDDQEDIRVIQTALDNGITLIDTAQYYADGKCEELVGEAIRKYPRGKYQILTKQGSTALTYDEVIEGCHSSLKRLGIDYIDYFVCHAPNADVNMHEFFNATNQLYKDGLIRHVGVSNFGPKTLQIAVDTSDTPICLNQVSFSLGDDDIINTGTYDFCLKHNIPIQAYRTLALLEHTKDLDNVAAAHNITIQQAALAYLNSYSDVHFTIRASSAKHWQEIKDALDIKLDSREIKEIKKIHRNKQGAFRNLLLI